MLMTIAIRGNNGTGRVIATSQLRIDEKWNIFHGQSDEVIDLTDVTEVEVHNSTGLKIRELCIAHANAELTCVHLYIRFNNGKYAFLVPPLESNVSISQWFFRTRDLPALITPRS